MDESNAKPKTLHDVPSDTLLRQQLCQQVSFKSLPPLGTKDSLEEIRRLRRNSEYPRRNILHSFVKATTFEKRPRRRLYKKKENDDKSSQDLFRKSNPELNIHKMRHKLAKEKGFANFDIQRLGKKIKNHFKKEISEPGSSHMNIKKEKLNGEKSGLKLKSDPSNKEPDTNIIQFLQKLNINEVESKSQCQFDLLVKPEAVEMSENCPNESESILDSCRRSNFNSQISVESEKSVKNLNDIQTLYAQRQLDFSSGDDAKNCPSENLTVDQSQIFTSRRRSVQWNREVDVVYYAGDSDGGKIVKREREPLREEADQQARHKKFMELVMKKNLLSNAKGSHFRDSWLVAFPK